MVSLLKRMKGLPLCLAMGLVSAIPARAQGPGTPTYYDSFYDDYYKSFPAARPAEPAPQAGGPAAIQSAYARPAAQQAYDPYYYNKPVAHDTKSWEIEAKYKMGYGNFSFLTDVGSLLTWDDLNMSEMILNVSRDFIFRNRQYVFTASIGNGSGSTDRTADDDIYHSMHRISLGTGSADLSSWSLGIGMRNLWKIAGFDATPYAGIRQKKQDFTMADHVSPSQFYLERMCMPSTYGQYICDDINIQTNAAASRWNLTGPTGLSDADLYFIDANGEVSTTYTPTLSNDGVIPGKIGNKTNLMYGDPIYDEDFCYYTTQSMINNGMVCLKKGENRLNLVAVFGGASLLENSTPGVTHIYNVSWLGPYLGLGLERAISPLQTFTMYAELFVPVYKAEGIWPYRTDWKQDPSFVDKGGSSFGFSLEAAYKYRIRSNIELSLGGQYEYIQAKNADTELYFSDGEVANLPGSILTAKWRAYAVLFGVAFKL